MTTLKELNGKVWYRFLKVIFILCYLPYFLLLYITIEIGCRDYHDPILPDSIQEVIKDPEFYKLSDYEMKQVLSSIDLNEYEKTGIVDPYKEKPEDLIKGIKNKPIPTTPLPKKYEYKSFYTWNITNCITYGLMLTICYILVMECIRRCFYYIVIGKVFPKE